MRALGLLRRRNGQSIPARILDDIPVARQRFVNRLPELLDTKACWRGRGPPGRRGGAGNASWLRLNRNDRSSPKGCFPSGPVSRPRHRIMDIPFMRQSLPRRMQIVKLPWADALQPTLGSRNDLLRGRRAVARCIVRSLRGAMSPQFLEQDLRLASTAGDFDFRATHPSDTGASDWRFVQEPSVQAIIASPLSAI